MHSSLFPSSRYHFLFSLTKKNSKFPSVKPLSSLSLSSNSYTTHSRSFPSSTSSSFYSSPLSSTTVSTPISTLDSSSFPSSTVTSSLSSPPSPSPLSPSLLKPKGSKKIEPIEGVVWIDPYVVSCLNSKSSLRKTKILFSSKEIEEISSLSDPAALSSLPESTEADTKFISYTEEKVREIINKRIPELADFPYRLSLRQYSKSPILKNSQSTTSYQVPLQLVNEKDAVVKALQAVNKEREAFQLKNNNNKLFNDHLELFVHGNGEFLDGNFTGATFPAHFRSFMGKVKGGQVIESYFNKKKGLVEENIPALKLMNDPYLSDSYTIVSFFVFKNIPEANLETIRYDLINLWSHFQPYGRIYVAKDGINAQMAVPTNVLEQFRELTLAYPELGSVNINVDTVVSRDDYFKRMPFSNLHIRVRDQALSDGFKQDEDMACSLDWKDYGIELSPMEWHEALRSLDDSLYRKKKNFFFKDLNVSTENSKLSPLKDEPLPPLVLDIRNHHEWTVGRFDFPSSIEVDPNTKEQFQLDSTHLPLSPPLYTPTFAYTWPALDEILTNKEKNVNDEENINKNRPIFTYCTGGARCGKAGAYLRQTIGADRVYVLKGGVLAYHRELNKLKEARKTVELDENGRDPLRSLFIGSNYVFDDRIQEKITEDALSCCENCGAESSSFVNCINTNCNIQLVQCPSCSTRYGGCCSLACRNEADIMRKNKPYANHRNGLNTPLSADSSKTQLTTNSDNTITSGNNSNLHAKLTEEDDYSSALDQYCENFSISEPNFLTYMRQEASKEFNNKSNVLRMISGHSQGSILSLFASYFDKSVKNNADNNSNNILELGSFIGYSTISLASDYSKWPKLELVKERNIYSCETDETTKKLADRFINESGFSDNIHLFHTSADSMIEKMREDKVKFNMIFIDADKKAYLSYLKKIIGTSPEDSLLNDGAFIIFDNVLWKGLVLNYMPELKKFAPVLDDSKTSKRYLNLAKSLHELNAFIKESDSNESDSEDNQKFFSLSQIMLPLRDGLSIVKFQQK